MKGNWAFECALKTLFHSHRKINISTISYLNYLIRASKYYNRYQVSYTVYSKQDYTIGGMYHLIYRIRRYMGVYIGYYMLFVFHIRLCLVNFKQERTAMGSERETRYYILSTSFFFISLAGAQIILRLTSRAQTTLKYTEWNVLTFNLSAHCLPAHTYSLLIIIFIHGYIYKELYIAINIHISIAYIEKK